MKLGLSTYSIPWAVGIENFTAGNTPSPKELIDFAAHRNIHFFQFGDNYPLHHLTQKQLYQLQNDAVAAGVQIQPGTKRLTCENVLQYLSIASITEADFIRMVIDDEGYHPSTDCVIQIINNLLPYLEKAKICLALENHDRFSVQTLKNIINSTDPQWVGICLDSANSLGGGEGIAEVVQHLAPYCINLHVKDFVIKRVEHKMGFRISGCIAGEGILNIPWLIEEVNKYGRCTTATLEQWSDPEGTLEATIKKETDCVNQSIEYLKKIL